MMNTTAKTLEQLRCIGEVICTHTTAKTLEQLRCIGEVICVGGSCHRRFTIIFVLFVPSSRRIRAKKEAQEAFDDKIN